MDVERALQRGDRLGAVRGGVDEIGDDGLMRVMREGHRVRAGTERSCFAFFDHAAVREMNREPAAAERGAAVATADFDAFGKAGNTAVLA